MKCTDFERDIYLFAELSQEERSRLEDHLAECASCKELFQSVYHAGQLVQSVASVKKEIPHAARLTHKILARVAQQKPQPSFRLDLSLRKGHLVRYAFSLASFLLVFGFGLEFFGRPEKMESEDSINTSIVVSSSRFREELAKYKQSHSAGSLATCASPLRPTEYLQCLKNRLK
jgi:hypothetical protein